VAWDVLRCLRLRGHRGREGFNHSAMDGGCGFAVQLLIDDGFDEGFEGRLRTGDTHGEGAGTFDELAEFRVCGGEFAAGESVVVARQTWAVERTRHVLTVSQRTEECLASGGEFGLDWFAFTSAIPIGQGRCSGESSRGKGCARDVVQTKCDEFDNRMLQVKNQLRVGTCELVRSFPLLYS